jgi:hypothetical protein
VVTSPVVLLPNVPVAVYCCTPPGAIIAFNGEIVIPVIALADGKKLPQAVRETNIATAASNAKTSSCEYLERNTPIW